MGKAIVVTESAVRPITIGSYVLAETGLTVVGHPTWAEHLAAGDVIQRMIKSCQWAFGDWQNYARSRPDFAMFRDAVVVAAGISLQTAKNVAYVAGAIAPSRRRDTVDFSTHAEVAGLEPSDQSKWLEKTETEGWTRQELRDRVRSAKRNTVASGRADGHYTVDVTVQMDVQAESLYLAEQAAWAALKGACKAVRGRVIAATARE